jgi:integrase
VGQDPSRICEQRSSIDATDRSVSDLPEVRMDLVEPLQRDPCDPANPVRRISDEAAILVIGRLGLRKMEAARVQACDVDLAHDVVRIRRGKGGEPAEVPIVFADVRQALSLWLSEPGRTQDDYLVAAERGRRRPLTAPAVHRWFQRCCERAGLEGTKIHELRHSAGDRLWRETGDLIAATELLRHVSVRRTETYLHPTADDLRRAMRESDR